MPSSAKLECAICLDSAPPEGSGDQPWVAVTSCGHVFHSICLSGWKPTGNASQCVFRCAERNVTYPRAAGSRSRVPLPVLPLYIAVAGNNPTSEGDFEASQAQFAGPDVVEDDPIVDDEVDSSDEEDGAAREGESELDRLRRELRETRNTVREQRGELCDLKRAHDTLQQQAGQLEFDVGEKNEEIAALQAQLGDIITPEAATRRIEDLEEQVERLREALEVERDAAEEQAEEAETRLERLEHDHGLIQGDWNEARIKWSEERTRLRDALDRAGAGGAEKIKALEEKVEELDNAILHLKGKLDRADDERNTLLERIDVADSLVEKAKQAARERVKQAQQETEAFRATSQKQLDEQKRRIRALEGGRAEYVAKNKKLSHKLDKLKAKKGFVPGDDDEEEDDPSAQLDAPPSPAKASTSFKRTTSSTSATAGPSRLFGRTASRSRLSASPFPSPFDGGDDDDDDDDMYGPPLVVNNNSTLLASPSKRKRQRSVMDEDAWEVSAEGAAELGVGAGGGDENRAGGARGGGRLVDDDDDDEEDSDIEIVEPPTKGKGKERASTSTSSSRPFASHSRLGNTLPFSSTAPTSTASTRSSAFPTLFSSTSTSSASQPIASGGWGAAAAKKPALSQQKTDKYLPAFAGGGSKQKTLEFGQKKRPKVGKK
ncbi:hypothetical protein JCM6882_003411 [Rhodosporidiobolus microsporus]